MRRDLLNFCKKRVRERAQLNRIDQCRIKLPRPEDRKRQLYVVVLYCHHYILSNCIWFGRRNYIKNAFYPRSSTNAEMRTQNRTHTQIYRNFHPLSLLCSLTFFLSLALSSLFHAFFFLILLLSLLISQRIRLNILNTDGKSTAY